MQTTHALAGALYFILSLPVFSQELIINEFSNGYSGNREYIELLVAGASCSTADIRLWIFDDNNGDFSGGPIAGAGISSGHFRFRNLPQWQDVPVGSILLIYNASDKNPCITLPDDPLDSNNDSVYVIPSSDAGLEYAGTVPAVGNSAYVPAIYTTPSSWLSLEFSNPGDAVQVRTPSASYFHGVAYGEAGSNINGGPDNIMVKNGNGLQTCFSFLNTTDDDFRLVSNWGYTNVLSENDAVNQTPGVPNNAANILYIKSLRNCSETPVEINSFSAKKLGDHIILSWKSVNESSIEGYRIMRKVSGESFFREIAFLTAQNNPSVPLHYMYIDSADICGNVFYSLQSVEHSGQTFFKKMIEQEMPCLQDDIAVYPNPVSANTIIEIRPGTEPDADLLSISLIDLSGRELWYSTVHIDPNQKRILVHLPVRNYTSGLYLIKVMTNKLYLRARMILIR